ncbi:MAG: DNA polymerase III subunit alpha [Clostridia bacterium]|nr:DNA polymerase III subunit alpha [Clostridia bacterium]
MGGFVHLHNHTEYSLLDGACRVEQMILAAKEMGQDAIAITDHGVMYGVIEFYKQAKKHGIKPILGCEVYVAQRTRFDKEHAFDSSSYHLVLLCENEKGYQNLIKLVSAGWTEGFYNKPRIDHDILRDHTEGLIALSACLAGELPRMIEQDDYEGAKKRALEYRDMFGEDNYFIEIQDHGMPEQLRVNDALIRISEETGIGLVATNDCHYIKKEDAKMHAVLLCVQTKDVITNPNAFKFPTDEFYLKSEDEMRSLFPSHPQAFDNTVSIAQRCNVEIEFGNTKLPNFDVPNGQSHYDYFRDRCYDGMKKRYGENPPQEYIDRLEYELNTINRMGYVDYYLIVHDFIKYAKDTGIPVGPGRGSGAGSIAAYCIGITDIDPMRYNLLFERFLNPERVSMPDFDVDFCKLRRQEVIEYVKRKYGTDHVAQIVAIGTMLARNAIRDTARAMGIPYATADRVAKLVPKVLNITLKEAMELSPEMRELYETDVQIHDLLDMAMKVEGMPRNTTKHAAGVVITDAPVNDYVPLALSEGAPVTQFTMTELESLGLLKMDFLGIRNLTVIREAEDLIKKTVPDFSMDKISYEDADVYSMMAKGYTSGVFQFESGGMRKALIQVVPVCLEDMIAVISLYRPGPMASIPKYVRNRQHPEEIVYDHPLLKGILDVTNGCIIYQEQVMQIFRELAGYTFGRADVVRRAMSKKKHDVLEKEREVFINGLVDDDGNVIVDGAVRRGVDARIAEKLFNEIFAFANYAFNKSHAACYAVVAYQTAYLKCKHPKEYLAALLTYPDRREQVNEYIAESLRLGIEVLPPHVNESIGNFTVEGNAIRFGLTAIKNLGAGVIESIISEREQSGSFKTFCDFCDRMYGRDINKRAIESLIKAGALDGLAENRRQMLSSLPLVMSALEEHHKKNIEGQLGLFEMMGDEPEGFSVDLPIVSEFAPSELLSMEKETTEVYLSSHPLAEYAQIAQKIGCAKISEITSSAEDEFGGEYKDNQQVKLLAFISAVKLKITKNNDTMAFVTLEDTSGSIEMIVFARTLSEYASLVKAENVIQVSGRISFSDEEAKIVCEAIYPASADPNQQAEEKKKSSRPGLYLKCPSMSCDELEKAKKVLRIFGGPVKVYVYSQQDKQLSLAPQDLWISPNNVMLSELSRILGSENVKIIKS